MSSDSAPAPFDGDTPSAPRKRGWLPYAGGALLLALIVTGLWPRPLPVETATAARGPLMVTVDEEGQTRVRHRYVVSSPVAGHLRRIDLKPGATVEAGKTVLAVLETSGADLLDARSLAQAEARVRGAESAREQASARQAAAAATLALARTELERSRRLASERVISRQELDAATTRELTAVQEERAATFGLQVAEYELEQARALLNRGQPGGAGDVSVNVTSPVSGRILRVMQESARNVPAGFPLMEIGDPADLEVRIEVLSRDGVGIAPGARVFLEQWGGEKPLEARVRLVEPAAFTKISALGVEEQRVYVIADFVDPFDARPTLGDGYRVEARIVQWSGENVLRVPAGALFQRDGVWQTFVVDGDRARLRAVKPGRSNGVETEIVDGLPEGTTVIVYPGDRVVDGSSVRAIVVAAVK
ncbi:HlyD family efflux transporter periplasmic adaptor subunit [Opitutaceae bacterium]